MQHNQKYFFLRNNQRFSVKSTFFTKALISRKFLSAIAFYNTFPLTEWKSRKLTLLCFFSRNFAFTKEITISLFHIVFYTVNFCSTNVDLTEKLLIFFTKFSVKVLFTKYFSFSMYKVQFSCYHTHSVKIADIYSYDFSTKSHFHEIFFNCGKNEKFSLAGVFSNFLLRYVYLDTF